MKKEAEGLKLKNVVAAALLLIFITGIFMLLFAVVMYVAQIGNELSPVLATVSLACGTFSAALYLARKIGKNGLLTGAATGGLVFIILTVISMIFDDGAFTYNTLFHLIILLLSALIGGVMGVNKKENRNYI